MSTKEVETAKKEESIRYRSEHMSIVTLISSPFSSFLLFSQSLPFYLKELR